MCIDRREPRSIGGKRNRRRRGYAPARLGAARLFLRLAAQDQHRNTRSFGRERQPPARGESPFGAAPPHLEQHRRNPPAPRRLRRSPQHFKIAGGMSKQQPLRREAQRDETLPINRGPINRGPINRGPINRSRELASRRANGDDCPRLRARLCSPQHGERKGRGRRPIACNSMNFMQTARSTGRCRQNARLSPVA